MRDFLTAHTRRNSTRKFGPFRRASARPGGPDGQVTDDTIPFTSFGPLLADHGGFANQAGHQRSADHMGFAGDMGYAGHPGHAGDAGYQGHAGRAGDAGYAGHPGRAGEAGYQGHAGPAGPAGPAGDTGRAGRAGEAGYESYVDRAGYEAHAGDADFEPMLSGKAREHAGRHARKRRVGKIVPAVAAVAAIAGATAYGLSSGGHSQARQVGASTTLSGALDNAARSGTAAAAADSAGAKLIKVAKATDSAAARAAATHTAKPAPSHTPAAAPSAAAASSPADAATSGAARANASATQAAAPSAPATPAASQTAAATTLSCDQSSGLLPENVRAIVSFLLANGYSDNAAAGIAGNIYQESKGDPEAVGDGGGGLIGFTPLPAGYVTGNATTDLQTQLAAVLTYNQNWSSYLPALNSAASPADAADIYVTDFERAGIPVTATREASADGVASACGI